MVVLSYYFLNMLFSKKLFFPVFVLFIIFNTVTAFASFPDVSSSHLNYDAINYVQEQGIVSGYPDGNFKPDNTINRAEFTKIVIESNYNADVIDSCIEKNVGTGLDNTFFPDVPSIEWFAKYVCVAKVNNIIGGYPDGTFKPGNKINFVEAAKIIALTFGEEVESDMVWYKPYVVILADDNAIPKTITTFEKNITRGEMAEIIYRLLADVRDKETWTYNEIESGAALSGGVSEDIDTSVSANRSLYFGNPIVNLATESFPIYLFDCFTETCPLIPFWGDEWTLNTKNRLAFDTARDQVIYPRAAGVFQLEALNNDTGVSSLLGFENDYGVSYLPDVKGDTLAAAVFKDGVEIIVKSDLDTGSISEIDVFKGHTVCSWPAVDSNEKVYGICRDDMKWQILDENGNIYYSVEKTEMSQELRSLLIDLKGNGYFVDDGGIIKIDLDTKTVSEIMVGSEYTVSTITIPPYAEYIAGKAYMGSSWKIFVTNQDGSEFMVPMDFDTEPGIPSFGPYLVGSNERSKMQGEEGASAEESDEVIGCSDSDDPRYAISTFLDATSEEQRRACLTDSAKTNQEYVDYGEGIYDFIQIDELDYEDDTVVVDVWFWDSIGANPVGHLFHMTKTSGSWLIDEMEQSGKSFT